MGKPTNLKDLLAGGHINKSEIRKIARSLFDGKTTAAGPEGYVITAVDFDSLPEHVQGFVVKAILEFKVENVLDSRHDDEDRIDACDIDPEGVVDDSVVAYPGTDED